MERYEDNIILKTNQNKQYFKGKFYPNIPLSESDNYVITTIGDRLDLLAYQYYNDSTLWWIISMANNNVTKGLLYPEPGTQLRIPININSVITDFNNFNNAR
jgi:nucleoid-associated protein YgaU